MSPQISGHPPRIVIIGIGNPYRGDDAVGHVVTQHLRQVLPACQPVTVLDTSGEGTHLLSLWQNADLVILVDAVLSGAPPGTVYRLDAHQQPFPAAQWRSSTHAYGVAEALALARVLHQLPPHLLLYGIEGHTFALGTGLSAPGAQAVPDVVARIRHEIEAFQQGRGVGERYA